MRSKRSLMALSLLTLVAMVAACAVTATPVSDTAATEEALLAKLVATLSAGTPSPEPPKVATEATATEAVTKPKATEEAPASRPAVEITQREGATSLVFCRRFADGSPSEGLYTEVYAQIEDVSGNPTYGEMVGRGHTDQTGCAAFDLEPGLYVLEMDSFRGYNWGNMSGIYGMSGLEVEADQTTVLTLTSGELQIGFTYAGGEPIEDQYVKIWTQTTDVSGSPVRSTRVWAGYTDNRGVATIELMPGFYAVESDFRGYNWGSATDLEGEGNVLVNPGETTTVTRSLGGIVIELMDSSRKAREGVYCKLHYQREDVAGQPALDDRLAAGYTANTGRIGWNLTQGTYAVVIGDAVQYDIPVEWGRITYVDGTSVLRME